MNPLATVAFVFLSGLTIAGLSGALIEFVTRERLALREPFVSPGNVSRSIVWVLLAGPLMTVNEGLAAVREERIGWPAFAGVLAFCLIWMLATGTMVVGLAQRALAP
jgi:hypothetical protein